MSLSSKKLPINYGLVVAAVRTFCQKKKKLSFVISKINRFPTDINLMLISAFFTNQNNYVSLFFLIVFSVSCFTFTIIILYWTLDYAIRFSVFQRKKMDLWSIVTPYRQLVTNINFITPLFFFHTNVLFLNFWNFGKHFILYRLCVYEFPFFKNKIFSLVPSTVSRWQIFSFFIYIYAIFLYMLVYFIFFI